MIRTKKSVNQNQVHALLGKTDLYNEVSLEDIGRIWAKYELMDLHVVPTTSVEEELLEKSENDMPLEVFEEGDEEDEDSEDYDNEGEALCA